VRRYDAAWSVVLPETARVPGIVVMALGGLLVLTCVGTFALRGRGTPAVFDPPRKLVAVGPYTWVRNPMYIGGGVLLLGFALVEHSLSMILLVGAIFLAEHCFILWYEEPTLREKFGDSYKEYCRNVSRWIPRRPRSRTP
jgi:protein-S-isoprenylcysteine O-methyltransferase Ste14